MSEQEITNCEKHAASVRRLFEHLVETLIGVRREEMNQPVFGPLQNLNWPQLHENSIAELAFWRACSRLMSICGVNDFALSDYTKPQPKRLRRHLSAAINFAKFKEERLDMYHKITIPRDELLERQAKLEAEKGQLEAHLQELRVSTQVQREEAAAIDGECGTVEKEINELNIEQAALRGEAQSLKKLSNELKEKLGETRIAHATTVAECQKLQSQVVQSPDRVRRDMVESQRALEQERREGENIEEGTVAAIKASKVLMEAKSRVEAAVTACEEIERMTSTWHDTVVEIKAKKLEVAATNRDSAAKLEDGANYERQKLRLEERLRQLRSAGEARMQTASEALSQTHLVLLDQHQKCRDVNMELENSNRVAQDMKGSIAEKRASHKVRMDDMIRTWRRLEAAVESHHERLLQSMVDAEQSNQSIIADLDNHPQNDKENRDSNDGL